MFSQISLTCYHITAENYVQEKYTRNGNVQDFMLNSPFGNYCNPMTPVFLHEQVIDIGYK